MKKIRKNENKRQSTRYTLLPTSKYTLYLTSHTKGTEPSCTMTELEDRPKNLTLEGELSQEKSKTCDNMQIP